MLRLPDETYRGRTVVELGCGSGYVSIALAKLTPLKKVIALDLNPHAAVATEINAILAGVESKVEVAVSDLLEALERRGEKVDLVCGNIPQVLAPESARAALAADAPEALRLLADYAPPRGTYEDVPSLGLIANALARARERITDDGAIVLNLAGRPGLDVLRWVLARWGWDARVIAKSRVRQDPSTDIEPFA